MTQHAVIDLCAPASKSPALQDREARPLDTPVSLVISSMVRSLQAEQFRNRKEYAVPSVEEEKIHHFSHDILDFAGGCVAGAMGIFVGHPFDTIKVRLQTSTGQHLKGPLDAFQQTVRREGIRGLFKGIETPVLSSLPCNALVYFCIFL